MNTYRSLRAIQSALKANDITCLSLTQSYLYRIHEKQDLNIFLEVYKDDALALAQVVDEKIKAGTAGRLAGMIIAIKDNICYKGHSLSAASKILDGFESMFSATVVERLLAEDAIIIGRTNCDEFAMGSTNENSAFGPVLNPINTKCVSGGSSGGSAAAVAADLCLASLGSKNIVIYGRVSRWGLIAYASSFDQIGPFTHNTEDAALLMEVISGGDKYDSTSSDKAVPKYSQKLNNNKSYTIGYIKETLESSALDAQVKSHILEKIEQLKVSGHKVIAIDFPYLQYLVPTYYVLTTAEASSNLARYDGVHFGYRSADAKDIPSTYANSRTKGFGEEVQRRIMLGTFVLSAGYYDAYYTKAQKVRRLLLDKTHTIFEKCDFILSPTSPHTAFEIGKTYDDPTKLYLEDIFTVHANIVGIPAVSLPKGMHSNGMPFGIQLMAPAFNDDELLTISNQIMNM